MSSESDKLDRLACKAAYVAQLCKEHPKVPKGVHERAKALAADLDEIAAQFRAPTPQRSTTETNE